MSNVRVFISYSGPDHEWAEEFAKSLRNIGLEVWFDRWNIMFGDSLVDRIEEGLRDSDLVVMLLGAESPLSPYFMFEWGAAVGMGKRVVLVVPETMDRHKVPALLRARKYLLKGSPQETAQELVAASGELRSGDL